MNKYRNRQMVIDNIVFDSLKEARHYQELKLMMKAKLISQLEVQPKFILQVGFTDNEGVKHRPITYIADFKYYNKKDRKYYVEDCKGMRTEVYRIKKKLLLYSYQDLNFREI